MRLTKLDQQTKDQADNDCPLSGFEVAVAYILDFFLG